jgi:hypothetical protein
VENMRGRKVDPKPKEADPNLAKTQKERDNMKIKIVYDYDPRFGDSYWAFTTIDGRFIMKSGSSFSAAKATLLKAVQKMTNKPPIPESEELEV